MKPYEFPEQLGLDGATQEERVYQNAVERIQLAHEAARGEKLYIAFSGGKDSTVLWGIVCDAAEKDGVPIELYAERHYHITGLDPPELIQHMRAFCPDLHWDMYALSFWRLLEKKQFPPTRRKRWCCLELKESGGDGRFCCTGVRRGESSRRMASRAAFEGRNILMNDNSEARQYFEFCMQRSKRVCNPLVDWTTENVWNYIRDRKLPYCGLYDEGFERLGCIGCPLAGASREMGFRRWPKYRENYIRGFDRMLRARKASGKDCVTWQSGEDVFAWWMDERSMDAPWPEQMEFDDMLD